MNDLRTAAQQALEALLKSHICPLLPDDCAEAITALKAALAEPDYWQEEARRYAGNADYWRKRYETLAEPVQAPVAWWRLHDGKLAVADGGNFGDDWMPLYTDRRTG